MKKIKIEVVVEISAPPIADELTGTIAENSATQGGYQHKPYSASILLNCENIDGTRFVKRVIKFSDAATLMRAFCDYNAMD